MAVQLKYREALRLAPSRKSTCPGILKFGLLAFWFLGMASASAAGIRAMVPGGSSSSGSKTANTQTTTAATTTTSQQQSAAANNAAAQASLTKATLTLQARQAQSTQRAAAALFHINQNQNAGTNAAKAAGNPTGVTDGLGGQGLVPTDNGQAMATTISVQAGANGSESVSMGKNTAITLPQNVGGAITVSGNGTVGTITIGGVITAITGGVAVNAPPGSTISLITDGTVTFSGGSAAALPQTFTSYTVLPSSWIGVKGLTQSTYASATDGGADQTTVTITQSAQQALLKWQSFNVGTNTTLDFDQSQGGANVGNWVAINEVAANIAPSQILGRIQGPGQVYVVNQNGVIFGGASQVNLHNLTVSTLPINQNLVANGLLDNPDDQFLFSQLNIAQGVGGTPAFTPSPPPTSGMSASASAPGGIAPANGQDGDVIVEAGAQMTSPSNPESVGGRIALIGPNVVNNGVISTPDGQTILAAGLQVGFQPHASSDPSLRGLDVYVGDVSNSTYAGGAMVAGSVTNNGVIESDEGNISLTGANLNQMGALLSTTSVSLNGRIDLNASFGSIVSEATSSTGAAEARIFQTSTGNVTFGPESVTNILPELSNTDTLPATLGAGGVLQLALPSQINVTGANINLEANNSVNDLNPDGIFSGALIFAPNANVTMDAGSYLLTGSGIGATDAFVYTSGQIYLGGGNGSSPGATIDVSGSTGVQASATEDVIAVQLRGSQLENSPVQQNGALRGATVYVDILNTGTYQGMPWVGTPLADTSGYIGLIAHTVGELTANGGKVNLNAGGSVVMGVGSQINVSGGYINYQAATVPTTTVLLDGSPLDISQATPNEVYGGIYDGLTVSSSKWAISQTFSSALVNGTTTIPSFIQGGNGGAINISSPNMTLDGQFYGNTVAGTYQRTTASSINATFGSVPALASAELGVLGVPNASSLNLSFSPFGTAATTSPDVYFETNQAQAQFIAQNPVNGFGAPLSPSDVVLSQDLTNSNGFGSISINTNAGGSKTSYQAGTISVPIGSTIQLTGTGSLVFPTNIANDRISVSGSGIVGKIVLPDGTSTLLSANTMTSISAGSTVVLSQPGAVVSLFGDLAGNQIVTTSTSTSVTHGGMIIVPTNVALTAFSGSTAVANGTVTNFAPGGSISFNAADIDIEGSIGVPGGQLSLVASDISEAAYTHDQTLNIVPPSDPTRGSLFLGSGASLSVAGLTVDNLPSLPTAGQLPHLTAGGSVAIQGYYVDLASGSSIDASGGVEVTPGNKISYGAGGTIGIAGGQDPVASPLISGNLILNSTLSAYSGAMGGTLEISAPLIQIGGDSLLNGGSGIAGQTLWLNQLDSRGSIAFFDQGGFGTFSLTALGAIDGGTVTNPTYATAFLIAPGTRITPIVQSLTFSNNGNSVALTPLTDAQEISLLPSQRTSVNLNFKAFGAGINQNINTVYNEALGNFVMGEGAQIGEQNTQFINSVSISGQTVAVLGEIDAPAGKITVTGGTSYPNVPGVSFTSPQTTVDLGPESILWTQGLVELTGNANGYNTGSVLDGGQISLSGNIVVEGGAELNVSGASGILDVTPGTAGTSTTLTLTSPTMVPYREDSNGGTITITGAQELFISSDASLLGAAGSPSLGGSSTANGGMLSVSSMGVFQTDPNVPLFINPLVTTLVVSQVTPDFTAATSPLASDPTDTALESMIGSSVQATVPVESTAGVPLYAYFGANSFEDKVSNGALVNGGFASLNLGGATTGAVQFSGAVNITARRQITIGASGTLFGDTAGDPIVLSAPYVVLGTSGLNSQLPTSPTQPTGPALTGISTDPNFTYAPPTYGAASLTVNAGTLITVGNLSVQNIGQVNFNTTLANTPTGKIAAGAPVLVTGPGSIQASSAGTIIEADGSVVSFAANTEVAVTAGNIITLAKSGSLTPNANGIIPANAAGDIEGDGSLDIAGNMAVVAAQIYPPTETTFTLNASNNVHGNSEVVIASPLTGKTPASPFSAGGTLDIYASTIIQGGVLRAPDGVINLGAQSATSTDPLSNVVPVSTINLIVALTSQISVSANGMTIPYGIINSSGNWIDPSGTDITTSGPVAKAVNMQASNVTVENGAKIDISGGGDLFAYNWVSGTGGTYDLLNATFDPLNSTYDGSNSSFAILPGYGAVYAPSSPNNTSGTTGGTSGAASSSFSYENPVTGGTILDSGYTGNFQAGEQIYLNASAGLPAGFYTLLPARYALLPGAFLITPQKTGTASSAITQADGSSFVAGYETNGLDGSRQSLATEFEVESRTVVKTYAEYDGANANSFFPTSATSNNIAVPRLPQDAGQILLEASSSMSLPTQLGTIAAASGTNGLGGEIEIASSNDINIYNPLGSDSSNPTAFQPVSGDLNLVASTLSSFGSGTSLIIGGYVTETSAGMQLSVTSNNVTVNENAVLNGSDITLAANQTLKLDKGAQVNAAGTLSSGVPTLLLGAINTANSPVPVAKNNRTTVLAAGTVTSSVGGTITSASGAVTTLKAGTATTVAAGSTIALAANGTITSSTAGLFSVSGDGALLRVSSDPSAAIARSAVDTQASQAAFASGTRPTIIIGDNTAISGSGIILDSTYATSLAPTARLGGSNSTVALDSGEISLVLDSGSSQPPVGGTSLVLSGMALSSLQTSTQALSLLSYSSIDIYANAAQTSVNGPDAIGAAPTAGKYQIQTLALYANEIQSFGGGDVQINAQNVTLGNNSGGTPPAIGTGSLGGMLTIQAGTINLGGGAGANAMTVVGYQNVNLNASGGILLGATMTTGLDANGNPIQGTASLITAGNLTLSTPLITAAAGADVTLFANSGDLVVNPGAAGSKATVKGGLGATLILKGNNVTDASDISLHSGNITLEATSGNVEVLNGGALDVSGQVQTFSSETEYTSGGEVNLTSDAGNVNLASGSTIEVNAQAAAGNAGMLSVSASQGSFSFAGSNLKGQGGVGGQMGIFSLDVGTIPGGSLQALDTALDSGGFIQLISIRDRDDVAVSVDGNVQAYAYNLSADKGSITVTGEIDASNVPTTDAANNPIKVGGTIDLEAGQSLVLAPTAFLNASGQDFSNAGKGGAITLVAGAEVNGAIPSGADRQSDGTYAVGEAVVNIESGSRIDLSVAANNGAADGGNSQANGHFTGTLQIQAPRTLDNTDVQVDSIDGSIIGASSIAVVGNKVYTPAGGLINGSTANTTTPVITLIGPNGQIMTDGNNFLGAEGQASAGYAPMYNAVFGNLDASAQAVANLEAGVEIVNPNGDLILGPDITNPSTAVFTVSGAAINTVTAFDWDLSSFRFGPNSAAGVLTMRAKGNVIFTGSLSDGFVASSNSPGTGGNGGSAFNAILMNYNPLLPSNNQSWSYYIAAGADFSAADVSQINRATPGSVEIGRNDPSPTAAVGGTTAAVLFPKTGANATARYRDYYQVIRTGTGDIDIAASSDVLLLNQFATVYTAGVQAPTIANFDVPELSQTGAPLYPAQYTMAGGNVTISALGNIQHETENSTFTSLIPDSELELPDSWLYRQGYVDPTTGAFGSSDNPNTDSQIQSTSWWIDFSNFFEGVGALGGGNVNLTAGQNINNVDAVVPTNERTTDTLNTAAANQTQVELGGGNLVVTAGNDINAGIYYVESGNGTLAAGYQIVTNSTRDPIVPKISQNPALASQAWLPTTLFLGKGSFDVSAGSSLDLGPVANPFLLPEGSGNTSYDKTYFSTYSTSDVVKVASLSGNVNLAESTLGGSAGTNSLLDVWLEDIFLNSTTTSPANAQPWLRTAESANLQPDVFAGVTAIMPATLQVSAYSGDINLQGNITLSPSPIGTLELLANGAVNGLQPNGANKNGSIAWGYSTINVSDADPTAIPGVLSPYSYQLFSGNSGNIAFDPTNSQYLNLSIINNLFAETGSTQDVSLQTQQNLHANINNQPLHAEDPNPIIINAQTGNISGLTLYSPQFTQVVAGQDITDVALYLQNANADDTSIVEAGRNIVLYDPSSALRTQAQANGNQLDNIGGSFVASLPGDIQIGGPGTLEILAGGNLTLGAGPENVLGGEATTSVGITSIGGSRNPVLQQYSGADVVAAAGLGGSGTGLSINQKNFDAFEAQFLTPNTVEGGIYLSDLATLLNVSGDDTTIWNDFSSLPKEKQNQIALDIFYLVLRDSGRDHNDPTSPNAGSYAEGFNAIKLLFPGSATPGDITLTGREIKTTNGGNISLFAPNGQLTVSSSQLISLVSNPAADQGIVTTDGGDINIFTNGDVNIGSSRIFTLSGGNLIVWSSFGNIAAGSASKTVEAAPPTRVLVDPQSGNVETDLAGLASGGGIGVLKSVMGAPPSNVDLIAPNGFVDPGDAGIRTSGNLNIAAVQILNAGNITVGGKATGLPTVTAPNVSASIAAGAATGAVANEAAQLAQNQHTGSSELTEYPSLITVQVLGYGGGDDDDNN